MNDEKRYKEAIEKLRSLYDDYDTVSTLIDVKEELEHIFPELKESKEEKIRKTIIRVFEAKKDENIEKCLGVYIDDILSWLEKQGEQKHTDKVEPKFKVGDWVITDKGDTVQIGAVNNGYYTLYNGMDFNMSYVDKCWHRWTIEDAKDGDVLQLGKVTAILILKEFIGNNNCKCYCSVYKGKFEIPADDGFDNVYGCYDTHPATKEQCDLLFAKMKEAGYEWNAEKKELNLLITNGGDFFESESCEQKPTWSEEDIFKVQRICKYLDEAKKYYADITEVRECIDWLKSLKQRIKPHWKPSDEQLHALHDAAVYVDKSMFPYPKGILMKLYKQLTKLNKE